MSNAHRLAWIDSQIRRRRFPTAASIAGEFEISKRQAERDIEYLKHSMGAPISWSRAHGGYTYDDDTFVLPAVMVTEDDIAVFHWLADWYAATEEPDSPRLTSLFERLIAAAITDPRPLPPRRHRRGDADGSVPDTRDLGFHDLVTRAVREHRKLRITRLNERGRLVESVIRPYALTVHDGQHVVLVRDDAAIDPYVLRLREIDKAVELEETFSPLNRGSGDASSRRFRNVEPHVAHVRLDGPVKLRHQARRQHGDLYMIEFEDSRRLLSDLLGSGAAFEVVRPEWLRDRVRRQAAVIVAAHTTSGQTDGFHS